MLRLLVLACLCFATVACTVAPGGDAGVDLACPASRGNGTTHGQSPTANETWTAAGSPHLVTADLRIAKGVTLTLEPCAEVRMAKSSHLAIDGALVANGTASKPISIGASDLANAFGGIVVWAPGTASLSYVVVSNGGADTANTYGALEARGDQLARAQEVLKVDHVTVNGAVKFGVSLRAGAAFTKDSQELTVKGASAAPVRINPRLLTNLPSGSYTGNGKDLIVVETEAYGAATLEDVTIHDRGVPYQIGGEVSFGDFVVGGGIAPVTRTIDPGVVLKFWRNDAAGLYLDKGSNNRAATATVVAQGTAAKPIIFTSAQSVPAPGDWLGLSFGNVPAAGNRLDHVEIHYAGGPSYSNGFHCMPNGSLSPNENAALTLWGLPSSAFLTNSLIADSAALGVNLAYAGDFVDLVPSNGFTNLGACKTSYPRQAKGGCPASVPCP